MADLLAVEKLCAGYGEARVISDLSLKLGEGRSLAVLGRNGVGKTTLINSLVGVTKRHAGRVVFAGADVSALSPHQRARAGLGWVPQERNIFRSLSVEENLAAVALPGAWTLERVYKLFPRLQERRRNGGGQLSGGEQQMLAIGRILRTGARFLMRDEPTEGLAPVIIQQIGHTIKRLKNEGFTILLVEQNFRFAATVADRYYIVEHGKIIDGFANAELQSNMDKLHTYLGV